MKEEELQKRRLLDLANECYQQNHYTYSGFLTPAEQSEILCDREAFSFVPYEFGGGIETAERKVVRFGSVEEFGYEEPWPFVCLHVTPLAAKFAEELSHRDYLGALMHLGIKRELLGDIYVKGKEAYIMVLYNMKDYIMEEFTKVRHTLIQTKVLEEIPEILKPERLEKQVVVSSNRVDSIVGAVYHLSRSQSVNLFREQKIYVNGRVFENNSGTLKEEDVVSVRGYGKFVMKREGGMTKKSRQYITVELYV